MKQVMKRILSFVFVVCIAFMGVITTPIIGANAAETTIVFQLGEDGSATHKDNNTSSSTYTETVDGYTLNVTGGTNCYPKSIDAKGNSCIKLGKSDEAGSFSFTVPDDVNSVVIAAAKYKAKATKLSVNGTTHTLTKSSNDGAYGEITVNTTSNKTVSVATVSGGYRAMINSITYVVEVGEVDPDAPVVPTISISGENYTVVGGAAIDLTATSNIENVEVAWTSSNTNVATIANGKVTPVAVGKTTITAAIEGASATKDIVVYPVANSVLTIAQALEVCNLTGTTNAPYSYSTTGVVKSIDTAYNAKYGNITVTITDGTNSIKAYRMKGGETLQEGQEIKVTGALMNYDGDTPEFNAGCTYELILSETGEAIQEAVNAVEAEMSLAYKYVETFEEREIPAAGQIVTDTLDKAKTGVSNQGYQDWKQDVTLESGAVYAGNTCGTSNNYIQLNNKSSNGTGIVTKVSGGMARKVIVEWASGNTAGRKLTVYGKHTAYSSSKDVYTTDKGDELGTIAVGTTELTITGDYEYIAFYGGSAIYLTSISIEWETIGEASGETEEVQVLKDSQFLLRFGVNESLFDIENATTFGIRVSDGNKTKDYTFTKEDVENGYVSVIIDLGDIIDNTAALTTEFTVIAFVADAETTYYSTAVKEYSVAGMIKEYYEEKNIEGVKHLYDYLVAKNAI